MRHGNVQILMATCNGENYLEEQLDSIVNQTYSDWELLIRDDVSRDSTRDIISKYKKRLPEKIRVIEDNDGNLGFCQNFNRLMQHASTSVTCFADQDDIWLPSKVEESVEALEQAENEHGKRTPILIHHDYSVIDADSTTQTPSANRDHGIEMEDHSLSHILAQSTVRGFSMTINRALLEKALPIPRKQPFHDIYLTGIASVFGAISFIDRPLTKYRIHGNNIVGGKNPFSNTSCSDFGIKEWFNGHAFEKIIRLGKASRHKVLLTCDALQDFVERFNEEIPEEKLDILESYLELRTASYLRRRKIILSEGFTPSSWLERLSCAIFG